jgi:CheY-like chemotaxis protein
MAKIPTNRDKANLEDWMVRVSFAEAGEGKKGFEVTGLDEVRKLALDKIVMVRSDEGAENAEESVEEKPDVGSRAVAEQDSRDKVLVMILDDEPIVGKRLKPALAKHGFEVEVYEEPTKALKRLEETAFDIVVTDLRMEEVDGIQILEHVMSTTDRTRVILITGYATVEVAREALVKGAFDFIAKPFKPRDLQAVINKAALSLGHMGIR